MHARARVCLCVSLSLCVRARVCVCVCASVCLSGFEFCRLGFWEITSGWSSPDLGLVHFGPICGHLVWSEGRGLVVHTLHFSIVLGYAPQFGTGPATASPKCQIRAPNPSRGNTIEIRLRLRQRCLRLRRRRRNVGVDVS